MSQSQPITSTSVSPWATLPLLAEPSRYVACHWDLRAHPAKRAYWLQLFRTHFPALLAEARSEAASRGQDDALTQQQCANAANLFGDYLDAIERDPLNAGRLDIMAICLQREAALRAAGIADPYALAKRNQNEVALAVLPRLLTEIDALPAAQRDARLVCGIFAGNIFDMGATKTNDLFRDGGKVDFHETLAKLRPRPWAHDDLDRWLHRLASAAPHHQALLFVDNAGPDVILGMIPFARHLLQRGTRVILTANPKPSLNDITISELDELITRIATFDDTLAQARRDGRLTLVSSGNDAPLIDLTRIAPELAAVALPGQVDLLVLEGMGRAVESNWDARFLCETIKVAMIKDQGVAEALGWEVYDLAFRYEPAPV